MTANENIKVTRIGVDPTPGTAWIIDQSLPTSILEAIDAFRLNLPLDSKRPTVDRRFFADGLTDDDPSRWDACTWACQNESARERECESNDDDGCGTTPLDIQRDRPIASVLEQALHHSLAQTNSQDSIDMNGDSVALHVLRYMRFLEYTKPESKLDPHTDGTKRCDDTGHTSTHTMLLYLTDCEEGGQTVLLRQCNASTTSDNIIHATVPRRGRILLFPHRTPHEGATVVDVPKICLRAEVYVGME